MSKILPLILSTAMFTIVAPIGLTVLIPWLLLPPQSARAQGAASWVAVALMCSGALVYVWCAGEFIFRGHGTPAPYHAPKFLVERGLYRYTRNPMYLGIAAVLAGEVVYFRSIRLAIYLTVVSIGFYLRVVRYEEPRLRKTFDSRFEDYCRRVPRWL